jgi:ankyrin repeat protein
MAAVKAGDGPKITSLLGKPVDIGFADDKGKTALHYGARSAPKDIFALLVGKATLDDVKRADRNGRTPLMTACNFGHADNVRTVLARVGSSAIEEHDNHFCNALHFSAAKGHSDVVALLLTEIGAGGGLPELLEACDGGQNTALHKAGIVGSPETIRLLLEAGANPGMKNCDDMTSRDCCASVGDGQTEACLAVFDAFQNAAGT